MSIPLFPVLEAKEKNTKKSRMEDKIQTITNTITSVNEVVQNDELLFISQLHPNFLSNLVPCEEEVTSKPGRRRRKNRRGCEASSNSDHEHNMGMFKKRKLSEKQVNLLEMNFENEHKLESERKDKIALELGLDPRQVAVWFQNRRARWKNKKLEDEYSKLKASHENVILEKCHLEAEVLKLKEELSEKEKELGMQWERLDAVSSSSPSPSFSMDVENYQHFLGDYMGGGIENLFYLPEINWGDLYGI